MGTRGYLEPCEEEGGAGMKWTWPYILQQVFMGLAWCFVVWAAWAEIWEIFAEKAALADGPEKEKPEQ